MKQNTLQTASAESNAGPVAFDISKGLECRVQGLGFNLLGYTLNPKPLSVAAKH